jgi:hypothetical protein
MVDDEEVVVSEEEHAHDSSHAIHYSLDIETKNYKLSDAERMAAAHDAAHDWRGEGEAAVRAGRSVARNCEGAYLFEREWAQRAAAPEGGRLMPTRR